MSLFQLALGDYCSSCVLYEKMIRENADMYLNNICYHLQQCIEKILKDYLLQYNISEDRTHDIFRLIDDIQNNCQNIDASQNEFLNVLKQKANTITLWEVSSRYYDSFLETIDNVKQVFNFAIRGIDLDIYKTNEGLNKAKEYYNKLFNKNYAWEIDKDNIEVNGDDAPEQ